LRHLRSLHFPDWSALRRTSEPRNAASGASRMLGVDFCNQLSKTVHSRGDRISIATTFVVTDLHGQSVPNERNDDRMGHEVHLAVSPESSEVRLTPQPQLRLNLVDRCEMKPAVERSVRTPPWPAFSAQHKAHKAASAAPCRVPVDQPVKVGPGLHAKTGLQRPHVNGTMRANPKRLPSPNSRT